MGSRTWVGDGTYCYMYPDNASGQQVQENFTDVCRRHCSYDMEYLKIDISIQSALFVLSLVGNCILLSLFITKRREITRSSIFICNLCCADLCVALFVTLSSGIEKVVLRFSGPEFLCKVVKLMLVTPLYASAFSILAMGIDRYLAVFHPLLNYRWRLRQWLTIIGVVWLLSLLFASPQLAFFAAMDIEKCHVRRCVEVYDQYPSAVLTLYITWFCIMSYFIPAIALLVIYSMICRKIWKRYQIKDHSAHSAMERVNSTESKAFLPRLSLHKRHSEVSSQTHDDASAVSREFTPAGLHQARSISKAHTDEYKAIAARTKFRMLVMTAVIVALFVLWNAPYACSMIWLTLVDAESPIARTKIFMICTTLANANASFNSWIYICFNRSSMCEWARKGANSETTCPVAPSSIHRNSEPVKTCNKLTVPTDCMTGKRRSAQAASASASASASSEASKQPNVIISAKIHDIDFKTDAQETGNAIPLTASPCGDTNNHFPIASNL